MILLLPLLRRFSISTRTIIGTAVTAVAVVLLAIGAATANGMFVQGIIAAVVGAAFLASASYDRRRAARPEHVT
ncbi:MAG TPA: hypothetical protein VG365_00450 [Solirubrobacteraceae bacterium]|jgi:drug/metabolite transporter (DMT)-like permease|nr:hypothetical protein [Solirubrobacteraceae bacterium]